MGILIASIFITREEFMPKILVVDDQPFVCDLFSKVLARFAAVITSSSLEDAQNVISEHKLDLVISDLSLTENVGREGFALLEYVRATSPNTKVIIMTGVGTDNTRDEALKLGAAHFLQKPFSLRHLLSEIRPFFNELG
jgi:DNA-binding NtrC family response regulator